MTYGLLSLIQSPTRKRISVLETIKEIILTCNQTTKFISRLERYKQWDKLPFQDMLMLHVSSKRGTWQYTEVEMTTWWVKHLSSCSTTFISTISVRFWDLLILMFRQQHLDPSCDVRLCIWGKSTASACRRKWWHSPHFRWNGLEKLYSYHTLTIHNIQ